MKHVSVPATITSRSPMRDGFGEALVELGRRNPNVVVITADLAESTRAQAFAQAFPKRFFQVGVAEQNMMSVAAGMALTGKVPFVCGFAVFSPGRSWDQLRVSVCYQKANVKVIGSHVGFSNGGDGGTHQALEDIAITRCLPNLTVVSPADARQAYKAVFSLADKHGPCYMRVSRSASYDQAGWEGVFFGSFQLGRAEPLQLGQDVTLIATGQMVEVALRATHILKKNDISVEVLNIHTIKPLDIERIHHSLVKTGGGVVIEEHQVAGGLGSAILEGLSPSRLVPLELLGVQDAFGESGKPEELAIMHGLTPQHIVEAARRFLSRKSLPQTHS